MASRHLKVVGRVLQALQTAKPTPSAALLGRIQLPQPILPQRYSARYFSSETPAVEEVNENDAETSEITANDGMDTKDEVAKLKLQKREEKKAFLDKLARSSNPAELANDLLNGKVGPFDFLPREFSVLIRSLSLNKHAWQPALKLFQQEMEKRSHLEVQALDAMIRSLEVGHQWEAALDLAKCRMSWYPRRVFNVLGDPVERKADKTYRPSFDKWIKGRDQTLAGVGEFIAFMVDNHLTVFHSTRHAALNLYLREGKSAEAVAYFYRQAYANGLVSTETVPAPTDPIPPGMPPRALRNQDVPTEDLLLRLAFAAEEIGNYSAALTILNIAQSNWDPRGEHFQLQREKVTALIAPHARTNVLPEGHLIPNPEARDHIGKVRDIVDISSCTVPQMIRVVTRLLMEIRCRYKMGQLLKKQSGKDIPTSTGLDISGLKMIPATKATEPVRLDLLTERIFTTSPTMHKVQVAEAKKTNPADANATSSESQGEEKETESVELVAYEAGDRSKVLQRYFQKFNVPLESRLVNGPAGLDFKVIVEEDVLKKWCEQPVTYKGGLREVGLLHTYFKLWTKKDKFLGLY